MGQVKVIGMRTVVGHQQPTRQAWLDFMEMRTGCALRQLRHHHIQVALERT